MNFKQFIEKMKPSTLSYFTYKNEWLYRCGDLPSVPKGYFLPIANYDIFNDKFAKMVLDSLKEENDKIDKLDENSQEYADSCFFVQLNFGEIFDTWYSKLPYKDDKEMYVDILTMEFWDYLKGEITYDELREKAEKFYQEYIKN